MKPLRNDDLLDERLCPAWVEPDGRRCIRLPTGEVWSMSEEAFAEFALTAYTEPNPNERALAIIARLTTPEEREQMETITVAVAKSLGVDTTKQ